MRIQTSSSNQAIPMVMMLVTLYLNSTGTRAGESAITFSSGDQQVTLVELYTSEGCSSCPPADAWLGEMVNHPGLWQEVVPVAFHVDYWNYLGWPDPLSKPHHGERQRDYQRASASKSVYTPGFIVNGREWRGWFKGQDLPNQGEQVAGKLKGRVDENKLCVTYDTTDGTAGPHTLEVALLGFDINNDIKRGENRGRSLTHQFAVLEHSVMQSQDNRWCQILAISESSPQKLGLAIWVTASGSTTPLQATGTWLPWPGTI